jgi:hypothetical protein
VFKRKTASSFGFRLFELESNFSNKSTLIYVHLSCIQNCTHFSFKVVVGSIWMQKKTNSGGWIEFVAFAKRCNLNHGRRSCLHSHVTFYWPLLIYLMLMLTTQQYNIIIYTLIPFAFYTFFYSQNINLDMRVRNVMYKLVEFIMKYYCRNEMRRKMCEY